MTLEERAASIADISLTTARGALRRKRIYDQAIKMLRDAAMCPDCGREVSEAELLETLR